MKSTEGRGLKMHRVIDDRAGRAWEITPCHRTVSVQPKPSPTDVHCIVNIVQVHACPLQNAVHVRLDSDCSCISINALQTSDFINM